MRSSAYAGVRKLGLDDVGSPIRASTSRAIRAHCRLASGIHPGGPSVSTAGAIRLKRTRTVVKPQLPLIANVAHLVTFLGLRSEADLAPLLRAGEDAGSPYVAFAIPKASGGERTIHAPRAK